ncbi:MAG: hypothetical protein WA125_15050 [Desulfosporosinus sp.]
MVSKRNQTIAIVRFLIYKNDLNKRLEAMTDEQYLKNPIGLEVGQYVEDLLKYCPESTVDTVLKHQDDLILRLGEDYLSIVAFMPYAEGGGIHAGQQAQR